MSKPSISGDGFKDYNVTNFSSTESTKKTSFSSKASKIFSKIQSAYSETQSNEPTNKEIYLAIKAKIKEFRESKPTSKKALATDNVAKNAAFPPKTKLSFGFSIPANIMNALRNVGKGKSTPTEVAQEVVISPINPKSNVPVSDQHIDNICNLVKNNKFDLAVEYLEKNKEEIKLKFLEAKLCERGANLTSTQIISIYEKIKEKNLLQDKSVLTEKYEKFQEVDRGFEEIMPLLKEGKFQEVITNLEKLKEIDQGRTIDNILSKVDKDKLQVIVRILYKAEIEKNLSTADGKPVLKGELFRENNFTAVLFSAMLSKPLNSVGSLAKINTLGKKYNDRELIARCKELQKSKEAMTSSDMKLYKKNLKGLFDGINNLLKDLPLDIKETVKTLQDELERSGIDSDKASEKAIQNFFLRAVVPELMNAAIESKTDPFMGQNVQAIVNNNPLTNKNPSLIFMEDKTKGSSIAENYRKELFSNFNTSLRT